MTTDATTTLDDAARHAWDVIAIGAGPAGALAARQAARDGLRTLLVDAKRFPRDKVCGGCLSQRAIAALRRAGLEQELEKCAGVSLDVLHLVARGRETVLTLPPGLAVSRSEFDMRLVQAAVDAGASFLPEIQATVEPGPAPDFRYVQLSGQSNRQRIAARVVLAADGLSRSSLKRLPEFKSLIASGARIGAGAMFSYSGDDHPGGQITMAVGRNGYVGLTRVSCDRLNVAAAIDPAGLQKGWSIADIVTQILAEADIPLPAGLLTIAWHGTPPLTSRPTRVAAERLLVIGDAAGYVEPFTGEGMAAALESALAIGPLIREARTQWHRSLADAWTRMHRRLVDERQATCRALAWMLRRPWSVSVALRVCRAFPSAPRRLVRRVNELPCIV